MAVGCSLPNLVLKKEARAEKQMACPMSIESKTRSSNLVGPICHLGKDLISAVPLFCSLSLLSSRLRTLPQTEEWVFRYSLLPTCLLN